MNFGNICASDHKWTSPCLCAASTFEFNKKSSKDLSKEAWDAAGWAVYGNPAFRAVRKSPTIRREKSEKLKKAIEERMCKHIL